MPQHCPLHPIYILSHRLLLPPYNVNFYIPSSTPRTKAYRLRVCITGPHIRDFVIEEDTLPGYLTKICHAAPVSQTRTLQSYFSCRASPLFVQEGPGKDQIARSFPLDTMVIFPRRLRDGTTIPTQQGGPSSTGSRPHSSGSSISFSQDQVHSRPSRNSSSNISLGQTAMDQESTERILTNGSVEGEHNFRPANGTDSMSEDGHIPLS